MSEKNRSTFLEILEGILEQRSQVRDLPHLKSLLYDHAFSKKTDGYSNLDLEGLIQRHLEVKMKVTDDARHQAIIGILKGADQYLQAMIER